MSEFTVECWKQNQRQTLEIESLRKQLAQKNVEFNYWKTVSSIHSGNITQLEQQLSVMQKVPQWATYTKVCEQLAEAGAEIERLRKANKECAEYFAESQKDLAASQAREQQLREKIAPYPGLAYNTGFFHLQEFFEEILNAPQDTSALEAIVQRAGEVMRERAISTVTWPYDSNTIRGEIRALPSVKPEDLK